MAKQVNIHTWTHSCIETLLLAFLIWLRKQTKYTNGNHKQNKHERDRKHKHKQIIQSKTSNNKLQHTQTTQTNHTTQQPTTGQGHRRPRAIHRIVRHRRRPVHVCASPSLCLSTVTHHLTAATKWYEKSYLKEYIDHFLKSTLSTYCDIITQLTLMCPALTKPQIISVSRHKFKLQHIFHHLSLLYSAGIIAGPRLIRAIYNQLSAILKKQLPSPPWRGLFDGQTQNNRQDH